MGQTNLEMTQNGSDQPGDDTELGQTNLEMTQNGLDQPGDDTEWVRPTWR